MARVACALMLAAACLAGLSARQPDGASEHVILISIDGLAAFHLRNPALIFSGAGVAPGRTIGHVHNVDVAPTIAALLGVDLPDATGDVLDRVLAAPPG